MNRKKKVKKVSLTVSLAPDLKGWLENEAKEKDTSISKIVEAILTRAKIRREKRKMNTNEDYHFKLK